eukprot:2941190-Rhodomonas_salina.1
MHTVARTTYKTLYCSEDKCPVQPAVLLGALVLTRTCARDTDPHAHSTPRCTARSACTELR